MHGEQCGTCGAYDDSSTCGVSTCEHCSGLICSKCKARHTVFCEDLQKRKQRRDGHTVSNILTPPHRAGHDVPPTTEPDRRLTKSPALGAPYDFTTPAVDQAGDPYEIGGLWKYAKSMEPVDQGIEATKDLLEGK